MTEDTGAWRKLARPALWVLVAAILSMHGALAFENRRLRGLVGDLERQLDAAVQVPAGTVLPPLRVTDWTGDPKTIEYGNDDRQTLLLVFSPTCPACQENWPAWRRLIEQLDERAVRVLVLDLTGQATLEYLSKMGARTDWLVSGVKPESVPQYRFGPVPQTILVSAAGSVEVTRTGVLRPSDTERFTSAVSLKVPTGSD